MGVFVLTLGLFDFVILSNVSSKLCAGAFAFVCHRTFTFDMQEGDTGKQGLKYVALLGLNIPISSALLSGFLLLSDSTIFAKIMSDVATLVVTFTISKYFVFNVKTQGGEK